MGKLDIHFRPASAALRAQVLEMGRFWLTLKAIIPFIPTRDPQLSRPVYEMVIGHLVVNDKEVSWVLPLRSC